MIKILHVSLSKKKKKKVKRLVKEHIYIAPGHRQQCGESQGRERLEGGEQKGVGGMKGMCNSFNNKNNLKNK